ncbi:flagellar basal body rod protein FlgB [Clostridium hydrogenum]|uniref:flagellar basal body rod protein FlgB n=1 Tax=Clostridium hydrogenum TaxID=2855764 RepID=UPI001F1B310D|nr:flagellar basal body rod protein FlgB [Clostridium hydrogenum]
MDTSNISQSQFTYDLLKQGLNAASTRQKAISNNIANVNTAGYKRSYVTFEDSLKNSQDNLEMKTTDSRHINDGQGFGQIQVKQDDSTSMNEDGNNVDIDTEMADEAQNTLMYEALISQINGRISMTSDVISGK